MLKKDKKIINNYELSLHDRKKIGDKKGLKKILKEKLFDDKAETVAVFEALLNEILCTDAGSRLDSAAVRDVILEVASDEEELITFEDFVRIFTA